MTGFYRFFNLFFAFDLLLKSMAKGTATGEFVVRTGCKRELQFVLKSQSEICGGESLGRTRGSRNLNGVSRSTEGEKSKSGSGLKSGIKKMRLSKDEEDGEVVVMSDTVGVALEEDEGKSDIVDVEEAKGLVNDSALVESMSEDHKGQEENGKDVEIENVVMNEDQLIEQPEKGSLTVIGVDTVIDRELVVACPADFSVLEKMASRSCQVKLERGLVYAKPCKRLTRSMLKVEGIKSEANADDDHVNPERDAIDSKDNCVDASSSVAYGREVELCEQNHVEICLGLPSESSQMSGHSQLLVKKAVNDTIGKPLRRFTRSLVKQEVDSDNPNLGNNTKPADLGEVDVNANDVKIDDFQSPSVTTHNKRGRPKKFLRSFPAKLKELFDCGILEGLTVYYLRAAKVYDGFFSFYSCKNRFYVADMYVTFFS